MKCFFLLFFPLVCVSQERKDDPAPTAKVIATLSNLTGWSKSDLGKWHSAKNAIPAMIESDRKVYPECDHLLKAEIAKINIDQQDYYCLALFTKTKFGSKANEIYYGANYWIFDISGRRVDTVNANVETITFLNSYASESITAFFSPTTWTQILKDIRKKFGKEKSPGYLLIQMRDDPKNHKTQFLFGTIFNDRSYGLSETACSVTDDAGPLNKFYYETDSNIFYAFMDKITPK